MNKIKNIELDQYVEELEETFKYWADEANDNGAHEAEATLLSCAKWIREKYEEDYNANIEN